MKDAGIAYKVDVSWLQNSKLAQAKFDIPLGVTALIGPSGAGKTTIARLLTGLTKPEAGIIESPSRKLLDTKDKIDLPPAKRATGYVSQDPALFPTMTVSENIFLAAKLNDDTTHNLCRKAGIEDLMNRYPSSLSGGEARRVAIIRALVSKPELLILDEPMNGLDIHRRKSLLGLIRSLALQTKTPTLLITHQLEEMLIAADYAVLIVDGHSLLSGTIEQVLSAPETSNHMGIDDPGAALSATVMQRDNGLIHAHIGSETILLADDNEPLEAKLRIRVLSRDVSISTQRIENISVLNQLEATIVSIIDLENDVEISLQIKGCEQVIKSRITSKSAQSLALKKDQTVYALVKAVAVKEMMAD